MRDDADSPTLFRLDDFPNAERQAAFDRVVQFASNRRFASEAQLAYDIFWSAECRRRREAGRTDPFERPEADAGFITYFLLDAPGAAGTSICRRFLDGRGAALPAHERDYLERLGATRMGLYRVAAVKRDRGLTLVDLWSGRRIAVREKLLTRDVCAGSVIAARALWRRDGAAELDGAVYAFPPSEALSVIDALRAEWDRRDHGDGSEERFLKEHAAVFINRHWFDHVFVGDAPGDAGQSAAFGDREPLRSRDLDELDALLRSSRVSDEALDPAALDGLLCAIAVGPVSVPANRWLPLVWSGAPPDFDAHATARRVVSLLMAHAAHVSATVANATFRPMLPATVPDGSENAAQRWCLGFMHGVGLAPEAWKPLLEDARSVRVLIPILALASPADFLDDPSLSSAAAADLASMLPQTVQMLAMYWKTESVRDHHEARVATVHRLKIALMHVRPRVWRRVEIASDTKLPLVSRLLLAAMGWTDTHLHAFEAGGVEYGVPDPEFLSDMRSERSVTLADLAPKVKDRFWFDYDFGDGWRHRVTVEAIVPAGDEVRARCIAGARACPPEDCGGPSGYADLLEALGDPEHDEHELSREWAPEDFDPASFDLEATNAHLRALSAPRRRAGSRSKKAATSKTSGRKGRERR